MHCPMMYSRDRVRLAQFSGHAIWKFNNWRSTRKCCRFTGFRVDFRAMRIVELLKLPEGKTLEFKRDLSSPAGILRSIVAFANTAGGTLLIGVEDGTRRVRGIDRPVDAEERLANLVAESIAPHLLPDIEIVSWRDTHILCVQIFPSGSRPHHLKQLGPVQGAYVRLGSSNRRADPDLIEELRRHGRNIYYDEQPMPDLSSEALDFRAASEQFSGLRTLKRSDMETLHLVTTQQARKVPTIGGVLLFGKQRDEYFPDAWIQAGKFSGTNKSQILDRVEIRTYPVVSVDEAIAFVHKHMHHGAQIGRAKRTERWTLPPVAIREAIINAVVHTDYSQRGAPIRISLFNDRIEVENPGILPFGLIIDDLHQGISKLRNRVVGRVFHALGLVEQWGSGIQRMTAACLDAGHPAPVLEEVGTRFRLTLYITRGTKTKRNETDRRILDVLAASEGSLTSEIAQAIQLTPRATRTRLAKLVEGGLVVEIGSGPQDPKRRYHLASSARSRE